MFAPVSFSFAYFLFLQKEKEIGKKEI